MALLMSRKLVKTEHMLHNRPVLMVKEVTLEDSVVSAMINKFIHHTKGFNISQAV